jgi:hypothetical protein
MQQTFWIGGDGLILLEMIRNLILKWCINSDGSQSTMWETEEDVWWLSPKN